MLFCYISLKDVIILLMIHKKPLLGGKQLETLIHYWKKNPQVIFFSSNLNRYVPYEFTENAYCCCSNHDWIFTCHCPCTYKGLKKKANQSGFNQCSLTVSINSTEIIFWYCWSLWRKVSKLTTSPRHSSSACACVGSSACIG